MTFVPIHDHHWHNEKKERRLTCNLLLDKGYCLIYAANNIITCSYFSADTTQHSSLFCRINFSAISSDLLLDLIVKHEKLPRSISLSHAFYIGKEIYKVELSQVLSQRYVQS